jgi:adenosylcobinamide-GDP ribazoletransferase
VGLVIGLLLTLTAFAAMQVPFSEQITACLVLLVLTLVTGALHVDGLADTADGVLGGATKERRLEIMRDSRIGSFGAIAIVFDYLLRYCAITQIILTTNHMVILATILCIMPMVGRWGQVIAAALCKYARPEEGVGKAFVDSVSWPAVLVGAILPVGFSVLLLGATGILMLAMTVMVSLVVVFIVWWRIGGMTGDALGAVNEIAEIALLLAFFVCFRPTTSSPLLIILGV